MTVRIEIVPGGPPASVQTREAIRAMIDEGSLLPGDRLPTVRAMAAESDLAPNTVARAYRELATAGYLEARGRSGSFVADRPPIPVDEARASLDEAARRFLVRARQLGFDAEQAAEALQAARRSGGAGQPP